MKKRSYVEMLKRECPYLPKDIIWAMVGILTGKITGRNRAVLARLLD